MALEYKGKLTGAQIDALPGQIEGKQDPITLEILREDVDRLGTIYRLGNVGGQTIDLMPATPSGDPLHYIYEAEGAIYNSTLREIQRTTPWGEVTNHRTGYWYLNGLGNITNEQMRKIYGFGHSTLAGSALAAGGLDTSYAATIRTNLSRVGMYNGSVDGPLCYYNRTLEVLNGGLSPNTDGTLTIANSAAFTLCRLLKAVIGCRLIFKNANDSTFQECFALKHISIHSLSVSLNLKDSPLISKQSLLYMINNSAATSAITIKLAGEAYEKFATDSEVLAALSAKPLVTLITE